VPVMAGCTEACTETPDCTVCGRPKALRGRSYPLAMGGGRCNYDCPGYDKEPWPGHIWPEEWRAHVDGNHDGCLDCDKGEAR